MSDMFLLMDCKMSQIMGVKENEYRIFVIYQKSCKIIIGLVGTRNNWKSK